MIIKGLNTATKLAMLILLVIVLNCSRRIYLHPPKQEKTSGAENGVVYMNDNSKQTKQVTSQSPQVVRVEYGKASYYADKFQGKPTASGELYDRDKLTAAHKTLAFGTLCRVTNTANKKSVIVRINDRGPYTKGRIIDLSYQAMRLLDGIQAGQIDVMVEVLK